MSKTALWMITLYLTCTNLHAAPALPQCVKSVPTKQSLSTFNTVTGTNLVINSGDSIPFNGPVTVRGSAIKRKKHSTTVFEIKEKGHYLVQLTATLFQEVFGNGTSPAVRLKVNGKLVHITQTVSSCFVLREIIKISKSDLPAKLEFFVLNDSLTLASGNSAAVSIIQLSH